MTPPNPTAPPSETRPTNSADLWGLLQRWGQLQPDFCIARDDSVYVKYKKHWHALCFRKRNRRISLEIDYEVWLEMAMRQAIEVRKWDCITIDTALTNGTYYREARVRCEHQNFRLSGNSRVEVLLACWLQALEAAPSDKQEAK